MGPIRLSNIKNTLASYYREQFLGKNNPFKPRVIRLLEEISEDLARTYYGDPELTNKQLSQLIIEILQQKEMTRGPKYYVVSELRDALMFYFSPNKEWLSNKDINIVNFFLRKNISGDKKYLKSFGEYIANNGLTDVYVNYYLLGIILLGQQGDLLDRGLLDQESLKAMLEVENFTIYVKGMSQIWRDLEITLKKIYTDPHTWEDWMPVHTLILVILKKSDISPEVYLEILLRVKNDKFLPEIILVLKKEGILNQETLQNMLNTNNIHDFTESLVALKRAGMLDSSNQRIVSENKTFADIFVLLKEAELFTEEIRELVYRSSSSLERASNHFSGLYAFFRKIKFWKKQQFLNKEVLLLALSYFSNPEYTCFIFDRERIEAAFTLLQSEEILTPLNQQIVLNYGFRFLNRKRNYRDRNSFCIIAHILILLAEANILTNEMQEFINDRMVHLFSSAEQLQEFLATLQYLRNTGILTVENYANFVANFNCFRCFFLERLPPHLFTQEVFNHLIQLQGDIEGIRIYIDRVIRTPIAQPLPLPVQAINNKQSTHTASVHRTVSESATALWNLYGKQLIDQELNKIIQEVRNWADSFDDPDSKEQAAQRGVKRLTESTYMDKTSGVSTQQLIALAWLAIHDDKRRKGTLADAKKMLCQGFHELQREYNIDEKGVDNNASNALKDDSACTSGGFNKIMEKLVGIHTSVNIEFITQNTAALKLTAVVREATMDYVSSKEASERQTLIAQLESDTNVESIWEHIKENVHSEMSVFEAVFGSKEFFNDSVEAGVSTEVSGEFLEKLKALNSSIALPDSPVKQPPAEVEFPADSNSPSEQPQDLGAITNNAAISSDQPVQTASNPQSPSKIKTFFKAIVQSVKNFAGKHPVIFCLLAGLAVCGIAIGAWYALPVILAMAGATSSIISATSVFASVGAVLTGGTASAGFGIGLGASIFALSAGLAGSIIGVFVYLDEKYFPHSGKNQLEEVITSPNRPSFSTTSTTQSPSDNIRPAQPSPALDASSTNNQAAALATSMAGVLSPPPAPTTETITAMLPVAPGQY